MNEFAMDKQQVPKREDQGFRLPLSSVRLLVPPLRLMSAFMWQVLQQKNVVHYGKLEEFVSMVTETVPHLLSYRQRVQLILGLRARMILEMLREPDDVKLAQVHLDRMRLPDIPAGCSVDVYSDLELSVSNFKALVLALLKDPAEKAYFFQEVFPVEYGPRYDTALKELMWELLSCLERLFPVPDLKKTLSWLTPAPVGLDECMQSEPKHLKALFQQHKVIGNMDQQNWTKGSTLGTLSATSGDCIISSLSVPPSTHMAVTTESVVYHIQPTTVTILSQSALGQLGSEAIIVTDYTEVELGSNEVAEESVDRCVEVHTENSSVVAVLSNQTAVEEEEMITVSQHVELPKDPESSRNSEEERNLCEKSTQCDIRDGGLSGDLRAAGNDGSMSASKAEGTESDGEGLNKELQERKKDATQTSVCQKDDQEANIALNQEKSFPLAVPLRRGRGRPRKNTVAQKVVQNGKRGRRFKAEKDKEKMNSEDTEETTDEKTTIAETGFNGMDTTVSSRDLSPPRPQTSETAENPRARYVCDTCGRKFTRTSDVRRHQLTHTGERPFRCAHCEKTFQHAWDLTKHCRKFHGEATFSCRLCPSQFINFRSLTAHHKKSHASELPHYCSICGQASPSAAALVQHRKTHSATQQYLCEQCGEGFDTLLQRSVHRQSHRMHRKFKCPQCDKTYSRQADVKRHLLSHTGERPHQCNLCGKSFALRAGLQKHQLTHTGERPFPCPHCPKAFNLLSIMRRHERMHTGERPFLCSQCGKRFLSLGELLKHDKSHTDARPHLCSQCQKSFKSKRALREHILSHSGTRPYPCSYCDKKFSKPFALNRHHLMHTGERPFACTHCEKTFLTSAELALHKRVHTGERPYICSECPWKFRSSSELARHRRTHGQQRAYTCSYCPKIYTSTSKLKTHMRIHTGEDNTKCPEDISHTVEVQESTLTESDMPDGLS
ncbi:zinc finger protein 23 [Tachysurus vachellii]|uniref:zinc finger protein 23 n=1 Tax=Tachysurus vachellii TaxID=175792 RepID=UPI00296B17E7|nr:zinc finger protein 23 [Tachysurus vachellii]